MKKKSIVVNSLWIDPIIGDLQILCIKSFLNKGMIFNLYTYNHLQNAPEGVIIKDANEILDQKSIFKDNKNSYATFSDWFRIELLHKVGGWWVDCDVYCIKPFNIRSPFVFATEKLPVNSIKNVQICNAVIKMPAGSNFGEKVLTAIKDKLNIISHQNIRWTEIGAQLLYKLIDEQDLYDNVVMPEVFCPNDYMNFKQLCETDHSPFNEITYGIHLWNKMWEWNGINPIEAAAENSFLGKVKSAHI